VGAALATISIGVVFGIIGAVGIILRRHFDYAEGAYPKLSELGEKLFTGIGFGAAGVGAIALGVMAWQSLSDEYDQLQEERPPS
jgi:hypothetical protein